MYLNTIPVDVEGDLIGTACVPFPEHLVLN